MMVDEQLTTRLDACCSSDEQPKNIVGREGSAPRGPHRGSWTGRFREGRLRRALRRLLRSSARASVSAGGCRDGQSLRRVAVAAFANGSFCVIGWGILRGV